MARLPDASALSGIPDARSNRHIANADLSGAARGAEYIAKGVQNLGRGISSFGSSMSGIAEREKAINDQIETARFESQWSVQKLEAGAATRGYTTPSAAAPAPAAPAGAEGSEDPFNPPHVTYDADTEQPGAVPAPVAGAPATQDVAGVAGTTTSAPGPADPTNAMPGAAAPAASTGYADLDKQVEALVTNRDALLEGISDPRRRELLRLKTEDDIVRARILAQRRAGAINRDENIAFLRDSQNALINRAVADDDPQTRAEAIAAHRQHLYSYVDKGWLTHQQAQKWDEAFRTKYAETFADSQANRGKVNEVISDIESAKLNAVFAPPPKPMGGEKRSAVSSPIEVAKRFLGAEEHADRTVLASFIKKAAGTSIDPAQTAWCAAFVNAVLGESGMGGTGSLMARSFLKYGSASDKPSEGDIVVLSRGDPRGPYGHVGLFAGYDEDGNVKVLGGNQGNRVSIASFPASRVLGFRKPPSVDDAGNAQAAGQPVKVASVDGNFLPGGEHPQELKPEGVQVAQAGEDPVGWQGPRRPTVFDAMDPLAREKLLTKMYNTRDAQLADAERQQRLQEKAAKDASDKAEQEYRTSLFGDDSRVSVQGIVNDPRLTREAQDRLIAVYNRANKGEPLSQVSRETTMRLMDRMRRPDGDPEKITNVQPFYEEYIRGNLGRQDFEFLQKQFNEAKTPEGESLATRKKEFLDSVKKLIDKSNPLMGVIDESGSQQFYQFNVDLDRRIQEYRATGKNPHDLLDPSKPDFMGKPESVSPYQKTLQQSLQDRVRSMTAPTPGTGSKVPTAPAVVPRNPGESIQDYMKRTGRQ